MINLICETIIISVDCVQIRKSESASNHISEINIFKIHVELLFHLILTVVSASFI